MTRSLTISNATLVSVVWVATTAPPVGAGDVAANPGPQFVAVKMEASKSSDTRSVEMTVDGRKLRMLIDTGCDVTLLHTEVAKQLGMALGEAGQAETLGQPLAVSSAVIHRYQIGSLSGGFRRVGIADLQGVGNAKRAGGMRFDGILGMDFLVPHAARVDLATDTLHLRSPFAAPVARLAGHWVCAAGATPDGPIEADRCAAIAYDFAGDRVRFRTRIIDEQYYFLALESETPARLVSYQNEPTAGGKRHIHCRHALYKLSGDTLTVLTQYAGEWEVPWDSMPKDFKPAKNFMVMHFKRTGPAAPIPAAPAAGALPPAVSGPAKP